MVNHQIVSDVVEIRAKKLYYESIVVDASKPTIIFLHDSLGCVELWRDFPAQICQNTGYNVLTYDRIGYGRSDHMDSPVRTIHYMEIEADILFEFIQQLNIFQPILFGHSDGGSIALIAAGKYPDIFHSVIVEAAHIYVEDITIQSIKAAQLAYETTSLKEKLTKYHGDRVEVLFKAWYETWTSDWFQSWNIEKFLPSIQCPLLFIQGTLDDYGTMSQVDDTLAQVNGIYQKIILEGVKHTPHKEVPKETLDTVVRWLIS